MHCNVGGSRTLQPFGKNGPNFNNYKKVSFQRNYGVSSVGKWKRIFAQGNLAIVKRFTSWHFERLPLVKANRSDQGQALVLSTHLIQLNFDNVQGACDHKLFVSNTEMQT